MHLPGNAGYEQARRGFNLAVEQRPAAVAVPADGPRRRRAREGLARGGPAGRPPEHAATTPAPLGPLDRHPPAADQPDDGVTVDPVARRGACAAPAWSGRTSSRRSAPHGLAALHGSSPDVGVVGYSLGGGHRLVRAQHGLATNQRHGRRARHRRRRVRRASTPSTSPTCSGRCAAAAATSASSPRWSSRSTRSPTAYARHARLGLAATPSGCCSGGPPGRPRRRTRSPRPARILQLPPIRGARAAARPSARDDRRRRARPTTTTAGGCSPPLRELGPELDLFTRMPAPALVPAARRPRGSRRPGVSDHTLLRAAAARGGVGLRRRGRTRLGSALMSAELRQLGGALGRPHPGGGAMAQIDGAYALFGAALALDHAGCRAGSFRRRRGSGPPARPGTPAGRTQLHRGAGGRRAAYRPADLARLRRLQARLDPQGRCRSRPGRSIRRSGPRSGRPSALTGCRPTPVARRDGCDAHRAIRTCSPL